MALIEIFHIVASQFPIDATNTTDIPQGSLVTLDANGQAALADESAGQVVAVGIAGDSRSQGTTSYTPESGSSLSRDPVTTLEGALIIGAYGDAQRFTQNRVADNYNEVIASGKMTVYHGGGEFWTDQYEIVDNDGSTATTYTPATFLYASDSTSITGSNGGKFTDDLDTNSHVVGLTLTSPTGYPSGVPGTGVNAVGFSALPEGGNSMSLGTFLHVQLRH
jgi:hypothetical protein